MAVQYGLLESKSSEIVANFFWRLEMLWNSVPLWTIIVVGLGIVIALYLFFRSK
jgi:hypothetical protein